jgi:hypothetical protein
MNFWTIKENDMAQVAKLPLETMNKVLGVLGNLPYGQVAELIQEVRQATQVVEEPDAEGEELAPAPDAE